MERQFVFSKRGTYYKRHGERAAGALRSRLGYADNEVPMDLYRDFRSIGIHIFRRHLQNSNISGLFVRHPVAGKCVLVNYDEDVYRQRFTVAHEAAHAILDDEQDVVVSFSRWDRHDLVEIRANAFASSYLMPRSFIKSIPQADDWDANKAIAWANKLKASTEALAYALRQAELIDSGTMRRLKSISVPGEMKADPELPENLSPNTRQRRRGMLKRGLSTYYVQLCLEAYHREIITAARMAELLLVNVTELPALLSLYGMSLHYAS